MGRFRNFLGYDRRWLEAVGSADSHGRALQSLGLVLGRSEQDGLQGVALRLFEAALPASLELKSPRAQAFTLLGLHEYLTRFSGDRLAYQILTTLAEELMGCYQSQASQAWPWFEDVLTYCNAALPHALLVSGQRLDRPDMVELSLQALGWLIDLQRSELGHLAPIGSNGFYPRDGEKARFDQQPVETQTLIAACLEALRITGGAEWLAAAEWAFEWFLGRNDLEVPLYDAANGGCHDGLHADRVNQNQGAESTLAFLLSLVEMRQASRLLSPIVESVPGLLQLESPVPRVEKP
jgi:hypothetical protein